jgi:hypothetical protein
MFYNLIVANDNPNNFEIVFSFEDIAVVCIPPSLFNSVYKLSCAIKHLKSTIFNGLTTELSCFDAKLLVISGKMSKQQTKY